jgi:hypothetical protein
MSASAAAPTASLAAFAAIRQNGLTLGFAPPTLRANPKLVLAAVLQNGLALEFASSNLRANPKIVLAAVGQDGLALEHTSYAHRDDREIVLAAVRQNGLALEFASSNLRGDAEIVLAAVSQNGLALEYTVLTLRCIHPRYRELALAAVRQNAQAWRYVDVRMRTTHTFAQAALPRTEPPEPSISRKALTAMVTTAMATTGAVDLSMWPPPVHKEVECVLRDIQKNLAARALRPNKGAGAFDRLIGILHRRLLGKPKKPWAKTPPPKFCVEPGCGAAIPKGVFEDTDAHGRKTQFYLGDRCHKHDDRCNGHPDSWSEATHNAGADFRRFTYGC